VDKLLLAGRMSPGICEIDGASSPREWEEIKGYGWSGGILKFLGVRLSHFTVRFHLYDERDWEDWAVFRPLLFKPPIGKRPRALDVWHPQLVQVGISSVQVEDLLAPVQSDDGVWTIEVKLVETRLHKASPMVSKGSESTPVDPYELIIKQKREEIAAKKIAAGMAD
jgi:hypothetical protein